MESSVGGARGMPSSDKSVSDSVSSAPAETCRLAAVAPELAISASFTLSSSALSDVLSENSFSELVVSS